jgi:hypothetical protein
MDKQFTLKLQEWLNTPAEKRDLELGATLLLQLTNNKILYRNIKSNLKAHADFIEFKLKRYLQYRLQDLTHEEVRAMQLKVDNIAREHALDSEPKPSKTQAQEFRAGKRADHDTLPAEIQALYVENASLIQKMRELHLQLRNLSTQASTCPDSDRYPFLKEIIELDKRYHQNWKAYDSYTATSDAAGTGSGETAPTSAAQVEAKHDVSQQTLDETARLEQKNILRQINLAKGRYKKNPSEKLKDSILSLYQQLTAPSDALTDDLKQLGIL